MINWIHCGHRGSVIRARVFFLALEVININRAAAGGVASANARMAKSVNSAHSNLLKHHCCGTDNGSSGRAAFKQKHDDNNGHTTA